jgi:nucleotide-binding universal stress UspA family protein
MEKRYLPILHKQILLRELCVSNESRLWRDEWAVTFSEIRNGRRNMIPQIKKILYTTDLTKNSAYAFRFAVDFAEKSGAGIIILHVIEPVPPSVKHLVSIYVEEAKWEEKLKYEQDATIARIKKRLEEFCQREAKLAPQCLNLVSSILVRPGHPVEEILLGAEEESCDLIVLGTHGKGFLKQTFLGSVARSVLDRTRKPVFIVPLPSGEMESSFHDL